MPREEYSMADKILSDLESIITKDEELQEFMVIPVALNQNKSPVIHVAHNICLESWCIKHVYSYAYKYLLEVRKSVAKMKLLGDECMIIRRLLLGALLINPDVPTFWNMCRELVSENFFNINSELKISRLILTHKSKSNEAFAYRKWLLSRIVTNEIHDKIRLSNIFSEELLVCDMAAQKCQNNYHAWCHRIWCLENILSECDYDNEFIKRELNYTENWISMHVSEHTGFHYRQYIMNYIRNVNELLDKKYSDSIKKFFQNNFSRYLEPRKMLIHIFGRTEQMWDETNLSCMFNSVALLLYDLNLNEELNNLFINHESIWYHRRYILFNLLSLICAYFGVYTSSTTNLNSILNIENKENNIVNCSNLVQVVMEHRLEHNGEKYPKILRCDVTVIQSSNLYKVLMNKERLLLETCFKSIPQHRNYDLARRHKKWLRYVLGITDI